jgi:hypothetical protein
MSARELETIPVARGRLVEVKRRAALELLVSAQRRLDQLANEDGGLDVDDVDAALDSYDDAQALAGEWIADWRRQR